MIVGIQGKKKKPGPEPRQSEYSSQTELQKEQYPQLRHPILQDTVQTDVVLPQDHTRLERTAPGDRDSRVTGLF